MTQPSECGSIAGHEESFEEDEAAHSDTEEKPTIPVGPRPRRLSDFNLKEKKQEMPEASSFFVFSSTNRYKKSGRLWRAQALC